MAFAHLHASRGLWINIQSDMLPSLVKSKSGCDHWQGSACSVEDPPNLVLSTHTPSHSLAFHADPTQPGSRSPIVASKPSCSLRAGMRQLTYHGHGGRSAVALAVLKTPKIVLSVTQHGESGSCVHAAAHLPWPWWSWRSGWPPRTCPSQTPQTCPRPLHTALPAQHLPPKFGSL